MAKREKIVRTDAEIAEIRAQRAEKKAQLQKMQELKQAEKEQKQAEEARLLSWFPDFKTTKEDLQQLTETVRALRKWALRKNKVSFMLPEEIKDEILRAYEYLPYLDSQIKQGAKGGLSKNYQIELGDLAIECLKFQDEDIRKITYEYMDEIFKIVIDWSFLIKMLDREYVSCYGWKLIRVHAKEMPRYAIDILQYDLDKYADKKLHPETWKKWEKLAQEYGGETDMREIFPRRSAAKSERDTNGD